MPVRYILSSVWVRLSIFSPLSIIQYVGLYVFSLPISVVMIERIYIRCLIIIMKSEVWTITHWLGLGHETMVSAVCLSIFLPTWLINMWCLIKVNATNTSKLLDRYWSGHDVMWHIAYLTNFCNDFLFFYFLWLGKVSANERPLAAREEWKHMMWIVQARKKMIFSRVILVGNVMLPLQEYVIDTLVKKNKAITMVDFVNNAAYDKELLNTSNSIFAAIYASV